MRLLGKAGTLTLRRAKSMSRKGETVPCCSGRRTRVSLSREPPPHVDEKPCSIFLMEDVSALPNRLSLWGDDFVKRISDHHGIEYHELQVVTSNKASGISLREMLLELQDDLMVTNSAMNALLVARGPIPTLLAQYHLESNPLLGLVLVDPLVLPNVPEQPDQLARSVIDYCQSLEESADLERTKMSAETDLLHGTTGWDRLLRLEPGAVPTMVIQTSMPVTPTALQKHIARCTQGIRKIHSTETEFGDVRDIALSNGPETAADAIVEWIDEYVL